METFDNTYVTVNNYNTKALAETLERYGNNGYKLVSTMLAKNKFGVDAMYLFFTKKIELK